MPFKTSSFNPTLFKKNLSRSWPLWGGVTVLGALFPVYLLLVLVSGQEISMERVDFAEFLYSAAAYALPVISFCYAVLVAMFVWSYLHNSRSVGMMHSLPVSRDTLFVTNTLSGLAMLLIPYTVVGGFLCILALCYGAMDVGAVALTILTVFLENLLFFGIATFCAMITGNVFAVAGYYLVLNFLAPALDFLVNSLADAFIFGIESDVSEFSLYFAPVAGLYNVVDVQYADEMYSPALEGFWLIAIYGLAGVLLLAASWALYRVRRSESAGDIVAFCGLRPVFRFSVSVLSALTLGRLTYEIFWNTLFARGNYVDIVPMLVCMALTAIVGYYVASMLLEKSLRVFKGSLKGVAVVCVATVVLGVAVSLDLFGIENRVPDAEDVQSVEIWGVMDLNYRDDMHPVELAKMVTELHRAIIEEKDYILGGYNDAIDENETVRWTNIQFTYVLKDGTRLERSYVFPVTRNRMNYGDTYEGKLMAIVEAPVALEAAVTLPKGAEVVRSSLDGYDHVLGESQYWDVNPRVSQEILAALLLDAREGNFRLDSNLYRYFDEEDEIGLGWDRYEWNVMLYINYKDVSNQFRGFYLELQPGMKHTLKALVDCGVVTDEIIDSWNS